MNAILLVALGGALGALARYGSSLLVLSIWRTPFPLATWIVNLVGCFLIGMAIPCVEQQAGGSTLRLLFIVGFLGSFTTFSTFSLETVVLWQNGAVLLALLNALGSVVLGVLCVWLGVVAASALP